MKNTGLDKILGRLEDLDSVNLGILVQRLARERKLQETVFNTIQDGILVIDSDGIVQYANDAGLSMIGLKENDIGVTRLWKMVPDLAKSLEKQTGPGKKSSPVYSRELELNYPERRIVRLYMVPIDAQIGQDDSGGYVITISDVTEDKVSMEELIENERTSSIVRLAAGVAHELGNPLNSLTIHLQLIERKLKKLAQDKESAQLAESVQVCQGEVQRLDGIITHFLEAVRPQKPELNELELVQLVEEVLHVQEAELSNRDIEVNIEVNDEIPSVLGDRGQIKQVFFNLVKNAMEAMQPGGRLSILAKKDDDFVYLQFSDTGSGISEEELSKVFQAYYTTKSEGHGLGMMIVQRIMREHGGQITIESRKDVGTAITLQFPQPHRRVKMLEGGNS
ncbi:PAS domain-containing sensor histidine kinase [Coraliomargarita sinensis]|uniref:histidine kinase n=1 Tax=Coraliomargarita sinensis TaxID=2174842 RepID=A0A317ZHF6_9BACT|nr:ATP-binding protein [Coraliomargarita sinensis]PXA03418.1 PAS domain-containing sensor histidine kinase [Coraliomargarita sinensis]